ncbi:MAG TPA: LemA family protein [Candidatus Polarisedimenticolaceae bacterium]|nr:LemA family protein [Candidatus Polarisedimenticolaceae bacterium]
MKKGWVLVFVLGVLFLLALGVGCSLFGRYNSLVTDDEAIDGAWAQVQTVLQRRADLIPNLVETVKGYAAHERAVFENVAEARSKLAGAATPAESAAANAGLTSALGRLLAIAEAYPELKANENFVRLQDELAGTENRIAVERNRYNEAVRTFNTRIRRFPDNLVASLFSLDAHEYFEAEEGSQQVPKVAF